ncbi:MAG: permease prefix domain 1-containing protein [Chloroflexota bacterium]
MTAALFHYLENVRDNLRLGPSTEREIIAELRAHVEDKFQELRGMGLSEEEAVKACLKRLGSAKLIAHQLYEAHSQGTWKQVLLASMPHLLFALLFALSWWQGIPSLLIMLILIFSTAIYGWWHGKPVWLFPWLGCSLLPVIVAGLSLLYLPRGWSWVAILLYIPLALWLIYSITIRTIKRDWLYSSLMLLPLPTIIAWLLVMEAANDFSAFHTQSINSLAPWIGQSFLALAIAVAAFVRLRKRWLKIAVVVVTGLLTLGMVALYAEGRLGLVKLLMLLLLILGLVTIPPLVEHWIKYRGKGKASQPEGIPIADSLT